MSDEATTSEGQSMAEEAQSGTQASDAANGPQTAGDEAAQAEVPEGDADAAEAPEGAEDDGQGNEAKQIRKLRREAAGFRTRLRDAEAERDALKAQVSRLQLAEVGRIAGLPDPHALVRAGIDPASLVGEDGMVDEAAVRSAVADLKRSLGLHVTPPREGLRGGGLSGPFGEGGSRNPIADALSAGQRR